MKENDIGNLLVHSATALLAGALGSIVTLLVVGQFKAEEPLVEPVEVESIAAQQPALELKQAQEALLEELSDMREATDDAKAERSQLAATLLQLTRDLVALQSKVDRENEQGSQFAAIEAQAAVGTDERLLPDAVDSSGEAGGSRRSGTRQTIESLVAAGIDEQTARELQARRDQYQLARLELLDQAAREGWSDSDQLGDRLEALDADRIDMRLELGDEAYDRYLFESGFPNRIGIESVISGSAADLAGLQVGDFIYSYANNRVFRVTELQAATREGARGEYVQLVFDRGGQLQSADVPRGPLGVTLTTASVVP